MNLILRMILASILALPVAAIFLIVGMGILFLTPFASTPLFGRLPGVSESFCPEGSSLVVERYSRGSLSQAKNEYRVICLDPAGNRVADVSNKVNMTALGASGLTGYIIAWLVVFRLVRRIIQEKARREKVFILGVFLAGAALLAWAALYVYRQSSNQEMERALMVVLVVMIVFGAVSLTAQHYLQKRSGKRL
jgi:hypothetical protein